jgi:hypothetical protein
MYDRGPPVADITNSTCLLNFLLMINILLLAVGRGGTLGIAPVFKSDDGIIHFQCKGAQRDRTLPELSVV